MISCPSALQASLRPRRVVRQCGFVRAEPQLAVAVPVGTVGGVQSVGVFQSELLGAASQVSWAEAAKE